jgi:hypothetical protein
MCWAAKAHQNKEKKKTFQKKKKKNLHSRSCRRGKREYKKKQWVVEERKEPLPEGKKG